MSISLNVGASLAVSSYTELQDQVEDWLDRDDLSTRIPTFILMAESWFNRELRTPEMETSYTFSVSAEDTTLPGDYLSMRAIYKEQSPDVPLKAKSPDQLRIEYGGQSGDIAAYAIVGGSIRVAPVPDTATSLTMDYFARIENLSVSTPSNWLLQNHPDLYLYATLYFAEAFLDNATRASQWLQLAQAVIESIKKAGKQVRWGAGHRPTAAVQATKGRC